MNCWTLLSPGSSSLLVISCIDVTSLSCGAWMTNRMLPSTHSRQPNFPTTFNCSPNRWEERTALKNTDQYKHQHVLRRRRRCGNIQLPDEDTERSQGSHQCGWSEHVGSKITHLSGSHYRDITHINTLTGQMITSQLLDYRNNVIVNLKCN